MDPLTILYTDLLTYLLSTFIQIEDFPKLKRISKNWKSFIQNIPSKFILEKTFGCFENLVDFNTHEQLVFLLKTHQLGKVQVTEISDKCHYTYANPTTPFIFAVTENEHGFHLSCYKHEQLYGRIFMCMFGQVEVLHSRKLLFVFRLFGRIQTYVEMFDFSGSDVERQTFIIPFKLDSSIQNIDVWHENSSIFIGFISSIRVRIYRLGKNGLKFDSVSDSKSFIVHNLNYLPQTKHVVRSVGYTPQYGNWEENEVCVFCKERYSALSQSLLVNVRSGKLDFVTIK